jgi:Uncharacterized protein conserved in bacteria
MSFIAPQRTSDDTCLNRSRRRILRGVRSLAAAAGLMLAFGAQAAYPDKPIQLIISFPPAGATDVLARYVGQALSVELGQPVVVNNRPGAGGAIGLVAAARSAPDGYHLYLAATTNQAIAASVYSNQAANLITDFVPIAGVGIAPHALVVPITLPVKSAAELIAYIKADPGKYNFASQGTGTLSHLEAELFVKENGLRITHVPYKGSSQALPDVVNGSSIMMFDSIAGSSSLVQAGKLKFLAVASNSRTTTLPNVPTLAEAGVKNVAADNLFGVLAPKGTPQPIIDRLSKALEHVLADKDLQAKLASQGAELRFMPAAEFGKTIVEEHRYWGDVVRAAKVNVN